MSKLLIFPFVFLSSLLSMGQNQDRQWYFSANRSMNFLNESPEPMTGSSMYAIEGSASIADNIGNLLFYTDGFEVWNSFNQLMPNGTGLSSSTTPTQVVILPFPTDTNKYYIFHFTCPDPDLCVPPTGLNYTVVDMQLNGDQGDVDTSHKDVPIFSDILSEKVMAVRHGNGFDWWVLTHDLDSSYHVLPVTDNGIGITSTQTIGNTFSNMSGELEISPNGEKLVSVDIQGFINILDFDRCEGILSNPINLSKEYEYPNNSFYGCAFSPNSEILYVAEYYQKRILQYDLNAVDIGASELVVYESELPMGIGGMQLGPDEKIYFGMINNGLGVIDNPNNLGPACNALFTSLYSSNIMQLPTLPNYNLKDILCDSSNYVNENQSIEFSISPNPFSESTSISWYNLKPESIEIRDLSGRILKTYWPENDVFELQRNSLPHGLYLLTLSSSNGILSTRRLVISE